MKKYIAILLSIFYLSLSIGLTVNRHYCGGKLASIEFGLSHKCPCGGKPMKKDCCKDVYIIYKLISHFDNSIHIDIIHESFFMGDVIIPIIATSSYYPYQSSTLVSSNFHPPPLSPKIPIFLLDRSLLI